MRTGTALCIAWLGLAWQAAGQGPARGLDELSVAAGPGFTHVLNNSAPDGDFVAATLSWRRFVAERHALGVEAVPLFIVSQGESVHGYGFTLIGRHFLTPIGGAALFWEWGAGLLHFERDVPPDTLRTPFTLRVGAGLRHALGSRKALVLGYRLHHISNAGRAERNPGLNSSFPYIELSFAF